LAGVCFPKECDEKRNASTLGLFTQAEASFIEPMECLSVSKLPEGAFCGDERYVALTLIGDLAKRNFAEKHHII